MDSRAWMVVILVHSCCGPEARSRMFVLSLARIKRQFLGRWPQSRMRMRSGGMLHCFAAATVVASHSDEHSRTLASESWTCRTSSFTVKLVGAPL